MSVQLAIRPSQLNDLIAIRQLGQPALERLLEHLSNPPEMLTSVGHLRAEVAKIVPSEVTPCVVRQLLSLYALRQQRHLAAAEITEALSVGLRGLPASVRWTDEQMAEWTAIVPVLLRLLSLESVLLVAKATDLAFKYPLLLQDSRVVTDLRPVFSEDHNSIRGVIVSHVLHVDYDDSDGTHSLAFAVDDQDLLLIIRTCQDALDKSKTAKREIEETAWRIMTVGGVDEDS
jgi:hypothetical protein